MKLGDRRTITEVCVEQECEECRDPAMYEHTYLFSNSRNNPASSGYGKDDISWCQDAKKYACEEHKEKVRRDTPDDMNWCSTFTRNERFEHLFLYWKRISEDITNSTA